MKHLYLHDICREIGDIITNSTKNPVIKHAVTKPCQLRENTVLFHRYTEEQFHPHFLHGLQNIVIITEDHTTFNRFYEKYIVVKVKNIEEAYWKFIHYYRTLFNIPVVGVTGTCGKTTTKEMIKFILKKQYRVASTFQNANSLALNRQYLLEIDDSTDAAIFEMGVAYPGNLTTSCRYFEPNIGIITTIGMDHLDGCLTPENYIKAKSELLKNLHPDGTLILNKDDTNIKKIPLNEFKGSIVTFGYSSCADYQIQHATYTEHGMTFKLYANKTQYNFFLPLYGKHNVYNAAAAIACSNLIGLSIEEAGERLASFPALKHRIQLKKGINNSLIIDDTYSTNVTSSNTALQVLDDLSKPFHKKVAVLGEMTRLGDNSNQLHRVLGNTASKLEMDLLITVGKKAAPIGEQAIKCGMEEDKVYFCKGELEAYDILKAHLSEDTIVLIKIEYDYEEILRKVIKS